MRCLQREFLQAMWFKIVLVGNPMMGTSKVVDMTDSKAIGRITEAVTIEVEGFFIVVVIADYVAKTVAEM